MTEFSPMFGFLEHPILLSALVLANWPLYRHLADIVFGGVEEMGHAINFRISPDFHSLLKSRYLEDQWAEFKLSAWFLLCALGVIAEYTAIAQFLEWWFENIVCCSLQAG